MRDLISGEENMFLKIALENDTNSEKIALVNVAIKCTIANGSGEWIRTTDLRVMSLNITL